MKLIIVVNSFPRVSETFLFNLVIGLEARGMDVLVLALAPSADRMLFHERLQHWSGRLRSMPRSTAKWGWFVLAHARSTFRMLSPRFKKRGQILANAWLVSEIKRWQPDWVHFAYSGIGVQFLTAMETLPQQKWMVSCRGSAEIVKPLVQLEREEKLHRLFLIANAIHCVSRHMVRTIERWGAPTDKTFVNYPSIDPIYFKRSIPYPCLQSGERLTVVSTGRLNFQKGYPYALLAMRQLDQMGYDILYHIIGDGENKSEIMYMVDALQLRDKVVLHGNCSNSDVKVILECAHVFLLSSLYEGVANAVLEAMALEIPVVSTRSGGMEEVIQSGNNGILVECFSVEEIAVALATFANDPSQMREIGKQGRQTIMNQHLIEKQIEIFYHKYKCA